MHFITLGASLQFSCSFVPPVFGSLCRPSPSKPRHKTGSAPNSKSYCRTYPPVDYPFSCMLDVIPLYFSNHPKQNPPASDLQSKHSIPPTTTKHRCNLSYDTPLQQPTSMLRKRRPTVSHISNHSTCNISTRPLIYIPRDPVSCTIIYSAWLAKHSDSTAASKGFLGPVYAYAEYKTSSVRRIPLSAL
jgi:hypothetical protein